MCFRRGFISILILVLGLGLTASAQTERKTTAEALVYDLQHPDTQRKIEAARLLGENKVRSAVPALIDASADPDEDVRAAAVKALVKINDTRALRAYIARLNHPDEKASILKDAIEGIIAIYVIEEGGFKAGVGKVLDFFNPLSDDFNPLIVEPYVPVSRSAIDALGALLENENHGVRRDASLALGILRALPALPAIRQRLKTESHNDVKVELIRAVYKIGDPSAGPELIPLLHDSKKKVRDEAIFALGRLRVREAVRELRPFMEVEERRKLLGVPVSGKDRLQKNVLEALAHIADVSTKDLFINCLSDGREDFRRYGAEGLGRIGEDNVLRDIARAHLREDSKEAKLAMGFALYRLGREEHLVELVDSLAKRDQGYFYLLEFEASEIPRLFELLEDARDRKVRMRLLDVIGMRGSVSALPELQKIAENEQDSEVLASANMAIRRINGRVGS